MRFITFALAVAFAAIPTVFAQPLRLAPADPAADKLVAEALGQTPEVAEARATVEAAQHRIEPARTLPDPSASFTYQNEGRSPSFGTTEGSFAGLMLSQPLPWPGKLNLAGRVAESEAREVEAGSVPRAQRTIEARVRNAWYDLLLAHSIDMVIDHHRSSASQIEQTTRARYSAGLALQQDLIRAQIEVARIDELKANQRALIAARTAELNRLLGRPQDQAIEVPMELPAPATVPAAEQVVTAVAIASPEVAGARHGIETGRASVDLARKNFLPDFVVSAGSMYRGAFEMGPMWQIGVGVSIPAWIDRRQRNQLAEAQALLLARTSDADVVRQQLELRTRERLAQLTASDEVASLYRDKILPLDELSLESAMASYSASKVPFVTVVEALDALYNDNTAYRTRLAESAKWRVAIDEASLDPTAMSSAPAMSTASTSATANAGSAKTPSKSPSMGSMR